ncbi:LysR substrate-binding domain-containing protein [Pseudooceanicola aestuarii]|uniref:LysR substrate-binding domain-containing protein n=1 Tax=Pseudooceanicola aestuarii TaxID=2697319 RepID=UPI0013D0EF32|nr:LysR substrate-binding domain-containing protein [Pseudooceanicola aestuarii]
MVAQRIKIRHLRCFMAVFRAGGIGAAADALALSQPAVTKTVKELESIIGTRLIERGRGGAKLTIQGELFMPRAAACLLELERAVESVTAAHSRMEWHVHVGSMPSCEAGMLPAAVRHVQREVPAAVVKISTGSVKYLMQQLLADEVDLVVGHMPALEEMFGLTFEHLYVEPFIFVVRSGHPLARARPCDVSLISKFEMILPENSPSDNAHVARLIASIGMDDNITDRIVALAPTFIRSFLLGSNAISVVPESVFARELASGELTQLAIDTSHSVSPVGILRKENAEYKPGIEVMISAIQTAARHRQDPDRWATPEERGD